MPMPETGEVARKQKGMQQLLFDLEPKTASEAPSSEVVSIPEGEPQAQDGPEVSGGQQRRLLQRAVLYWLLTQKQPTAAAVNVVTRISRVRADLAAFWSRPERNPHEEGPRQLLKTERTAIIQCYVQRDECWPDCVQSGEILPRLRELRDRLVELESCIRREEPELRDGSSLFEEYAEWRYEDTGRRDYHRIRHEIEKYEHALYKGTRFEQIRAALLADELYLAVPEGLVQPSELCEGWGLLWVKDDLSVSVAAHPQRRDCHPANRLHLVQNIAAAATDSVMFAGGIRRHGGQIQLVKPPRGHRKLENGTLGL